MKRDKRRVFLFTPLLGEPATRRPLGALGPLGVLAGAR